VTGALRDHAVFRAAPGVPLPAALFDPNAQLVRSLKRRAIQF
jgi:hypothetical protein